MTTAYERVFVLGAGFTKAFLPESPLLIDDFGIQDLGKLFSRNSNSQLIFESERRKYEDGRINFEALLTRLEGGMPYDISRGFSNEARLLQQHLMKIFLSKIESAKRKGVQHEKELKKFAHFCVFEKVDCITFNYDDVLDQALWEVKPYHEIGDTHYWIPDSGYGFFMKPSESCVGDLGSVFTDPPTALFKLHGSLNWRAKLGQSRPYDVDAILHHEGWRTSDVSISQYQTHDILLHLEHEPFIVPPVLSKSELAKEPILRLVWDRAFSCLFGENKEIIFVGYSFPLTDVTAGFLFGEAIHEKAIPKIVVVNKAEGAREKEAVMTSYRRIFPQLKNSQFCFNGAVAWIDGNLPGDLR